MLHQIQINMSIGENITVVRVVPLARLTTELPFFTSTVSAGFPSPADDYIEERLSLDKLVIRNPSSTFFVQVDGVSMQGAGIYHGDILVVDRSLRAKHNDVIVAIVEGEYTVKRLVKALNGYFLRAEHPDYPPIPLHEHSEFIAWGVVIKVLHDPYPV